MDKKWSRALVPSGLRLQLRHVVAGAALDRKEGNTRFNHLLVHQGTVKPQSPQPLYSDKKKFPREQVPQFVTIKNKRMVNLPNKNKKKASQLTVTVRFLKGVFEGQRKMPSDAQCADSVPTCLNVSYSTLAKKNEVMHIIQAEEYRIPLGEAQNCNRIQKEIRSARHLYL